MLQLQRQVEFPGSSFITLTDYSCSFEFWRKEQLQLQCRIVGSQLAIYRGLSGPLGPKPRQSLKKVSRGLRPRDPPRVWKKSFGTFSRLFPDSPEFFKIKTSSRLSGGAGAGGPGRLFSGFVGVSGPEGP